MFAHCNNSYGITALSMMCKASAATGSTLTSCREYWPDSLFCFNATIHVKVDVHIPLIMAFHDEYSIYR